MQATYARRRLERRLLIFGMFWLCAGAMVYLLARQPGTAWFLPPQLQLHLEPFPFQLISAAFPTFAQTIALSLLCVWVLKSSRSAAFAVCGAFTLAEIAYQFLQRPDVASWIIPELPPLFWHVWLVNSIAGLLGRGGFNINNVTAAALGGMIAYFVVLNTIPRRQRGYVG